MTTTALTPREIDALTFVRGYVDSHGFAPSIRELADGLGLASTESAHYLLTRLAAKGAVRRAPGIPRGLVILAVGCDT